MKTSREEYRVRNLFQLDLSSPDVPTFLVMGEDSILSKDMVECAWCKESKPVSDTTWFMPEPGENSVRLCDFCYENAAKQVRLHRLVKNKGDLIEAAA